ncbi:MAG: hypothetical protein JSR76_08085 [Verrucomicrobia bacterium]|nr:hypothetical protein [Verrucomicrobiota bacterium]
MEANHKKFSILKRLHLPMGQYAITGSGPEVLALQSCHDNLNILPQHLDLRLLSIQDRWTMQKRGDLK